MKLVAPNGKPSNLTPEQWRLVRTAEFKNWFGDWENDPANASKVVDENGEPLVVYHGTRNRFSVFDRNKGGESNTLAKVGFWFTPKKIFAENFGMEAWWGKDDALVYQVFLNIKKLKTYSSDSKLTWGDSYEKFRTDVYKIEGKTEYDANIGGIGMMLKNANETINKYRGLLNDEGYDGIIIEQTRFDKTTAGGLNDQYVALYPNQIKLADGTNITFDANNPDIRYEEGGELRLYHGTPYDFESFDLQKIGEGEGVQRFGHGVYVADLRDIANHYSLMPNKNTLLINGKKLEQYFDDEQIDTILFFWAESYRYGNKTKHEIISDIIYEVEKVSYSPEDDGTFEPNEYKEMQEYAQKNRLIYEVLMSGIVDIQGKVYWLNIDNHNFIEYGKKISEGLAKCVFDNLSVDAKRFFGIQDYEQLLNFDGQYLYQGISRSLDGGDKEASEFLHQCGITGIKYPSNSLSGYGYDKSYNYVIFDPTLIQIVKKENSFKKGGKIGGRTIAQTPAPKSERIYGSKTNKPKSAESTQKGSSIILNPKTLSSIKGIIEKHNESHPSKKIPLATAKAVVRRGMGAYSATHRPTISGGKPNSRVAWGLARLNAFVYKIQKGKSKSGKYSQDNDLIKELGYKVAKFDGGGATSEYQYMIVSKNGKPILKAKTTPMDKAGRDLYDAIDRLFDLGYRIRSVDFSEYQAFDYSDVNPDDLREFMSEWTYFKADGGIFSEGGQLTNEQKEDYKKWKELVNMSSSELKRFIESEEGQEAGLTKKQASELGIGYGRESAKWILKMKDTPVKEWTPTMWDWCNRQISFISRMRGNRGGLYDDKGRKTRKHTSLLIWGHNPEKYGDGGFMDEILSVKQIEATLGRKLRWDESLVSVNGMIYKKVYLRSEYKRV